jgi:hypothetical protein
MWWCDAYLAMCAALGACTPVSPLTHRHHPPHERRDQQLQAAVQVDPPRSNTALARGGVSPLTRALAEWVQLRHWQLRLPAQSIRWRSRSSLPRSGVMLDCRCTHYAVASVGGEANVGRCPPGKHRATTHCVSPTCRRELGAPGEHSKGAGHSDRFGCQRGYVVQLVEAVGSEVAPPCMVPIVGLQARGMLKPPRTTRPSGTRISYTGKGGTSLAFCCVAARRRRRQMYRQVPA